MSRLQKLIQDLCPDGVEYKSLGELGSFYGGLTGKKKSDFEIGNAKLITYMNVFSNIALDIDVNDRVKIEENEKQNTIKYGDILFTASSETPDECGMSSVLTEKTDEKLYLNSFCFGFRLHDSSLLLPNFSKHLFRSAKIRKQIIRTANGVTRFNISRESMKKVLIPLPPLPIQQEIVRILDSFTDLIKELNAELDARRKQYESYRDLLLKFDDNVEWKTLGEISKSICSGGTPLRSRPEYYGGNIPWLRTQEVQFNEITETENYITELGLKNSSAKWIPTNCVIVAISGATAARCAINKIPLTTNQHCCNIEINESIALYRYVFYWISHQYEKLKSLGRGARGDLNVDIISRYPIPIPSLEEQQHIVDILDRFDTLINDPNIGIPAEIEARQKQYEYYRDKLLDFKEVAS
jgi:type I restriction enzyme S subunit